MQEINEQPDYIAELVADAKENPHIHKHMMVACYSDPLRDPDHHMGYGRVTFMEWNEWYQVYFCDVLMFHSNETICFPSCQLERKTTVPSVTYAIMKCKSPKGWLL